MKTNELTGAALDWAVAKCEGVNVNVGFRNLTYTPKGKRTLYSYTPSTNWTQGGPIIEREGITISKTAHGFWEAYKRPASMQECYQVSDHPLIAAMRCYVASKLGDEVDVPKELTP